MSIGKEILPFDICLQYFMLLLYSIKVVIQLVYLKFSYNSLSNIFMFNLKIHLLLYIFILSAECKNHLSRLFKHTVIKSITFKLVIFWQQLFLVNFTGQPFHSMLSIFSFRMLKMLNIK